MHAPIRSTLLTGGLALLLAHCGGLATSHASSDAGPDAVTGGLDAGMCEGTASGGVPAEHRPTATACVRTPVTPSDGGTVPSCSSDSECASGEHCTEHQCGYDACLVDSDCATGDVCVCDSSGGGGLRSRGNECVPASCRVDADCGAGHVCEPSRGYCGSVTGFFCTSSKDTCVDPARDCACGGNACVYTPTVGHWVCSTTGCNG